MNLLVTGGAGFIGSHYVLRHVNSHPQDKIVVLDKMTYAADKEFLTSVVDKISFVQGDIADAALVSSLLDQHHIDAIVDFAAETHVDRSIADASPFLQTNVLGVQTLIEAVRKHPHVLFVHVSTDEVYGDQQEGERPRLPEDPLRPSSPYAASKAAGDLLVLAAIRTYGIRARITRCTNNYGPHQAMEKFIPTIVRHALRDEPIPVYGNGKNKRDWLYVTDHTDAIEAILADGADGQVFNISAENERENISVAEAVLDILGKPRSLLSFVTDRPGHDWRYAVDSANTRALRWKPAVNFEDGLRETVEWCRERSV